jgi:hypothetical protein
MRRRRLLRVCRILPRPELWSRAANDFDQGEFIYGRFPAAPYFVGLVKSEEHSGDRCIAHSFAVREGTPSHS